jgi:transposase
MNAALHRVIVTRARCHQPTRDYIARRRSEGKSTHEAIRCLKRYLAQQVWRLLQTPAPKSSPGTWCKSASLMSSVMWVAV